MPEGRSHTESKTTRLRPGVVAEDVMPYIAAGDRPPLDARVEVLADELASKLTEVMNGDTELSLCYKEAFMAIASTLRSLQARQKPNIRDDAERLAYQIFVGASKYGHRGAWLGGLDYALTRLVQVVPAKMMKQKAWKEEFRFWIYIQTAGALERAAMTVHSQDEDDWVSDALVGVLMDVKDEYKRRVNSAYEAFQLRKSGDCYTTPYRTEIADVKDDKGNVVGYGEVMKEFRSKEER